MKYRHMGRTGLKVSRVCLGTMTFGHEKWGVAEPDSIRLTHAYLEQGGNFIDTADVYSLGVSEVIVGKALKDRRQDVVLATKVNMVMGDGVNDKGLSRKHIMEGCDASLRRLGTDYIDLYQVHCWDQGTPLEETLRALDDLVRSGRVRYIGCSNYNAWQITKALWISDREGLARFDCLQPQYSLIQRDIETEILPLCADQGLGVIPWSPLGGGFLTGKYRKGVVWERQTRFGDDPDSAFWKQYLHDRNFDILAVLSSVALDRGTSNARAALGWLLNNSLVTSVIIGARSLAQLEDNMGVADWDLPEAAWKTLDDASRNPEPYPNWFISMIHGFVHNDTE